MAERPIIFSGPMVRAILDGRKTQTRRYLKNQDVWSRAGEAILRRFPRQTDGVPYAVGDVLWVRESCIIAPPGWTDSPASPRGPFCQEVGYAVCDGTVEAARDYGLTITPAIHMPRWAARILLDVSDVRVERLQDISEEDAVAEGCPGWYAPSHPDFGVTDGRLPHEESAEFWDSLNGRKAGRTWADNPWVTATTFQQRLVNVHAEPLRAAGG